MSKYVVFKQTCIVAASGLCLIVAVLCRSNWSPPMNTINTIMQTNNTLMQTNHILQTTDMMLRANQIQQNNNLNMQFFLLAMQNRAVVHGFEEIDPSIPLFASNPAVTEQAIELCSFGSVDSTVFEWIHDRCQAIVPEIKNLFVVIGKKEGIESQATYYMRKKYETTYTIMIDLDMHCQLYNHLQEGHVCGTECQTNINQIASRVDRCAGIIKNAYHVKGISVVLASLVGIFVGSAVAFLEGKNSKYFGSLLIFGSICSVRLLFRKWILKLDTYVENSAQILCAFREQLESTRDMLSSHWIYSWTKCPLFNERIRVIDKRIMVIKNDSLAKDARA